MTDPKEPPDREGLQAVVLVGQLGIAISTPIVVAVGLGVYLDRGPFVLLGLLLLGVAAGLAGASGIIRPYLD